MRVCVLLITRQTDLLIHGGAMRILFTADSGCTMCGRERASEREIYIRRAVVRCSSNLP